MKKLSLYIFLVLMFPLFGCERQYIKDNKIDGIGIGDSLLDYFSEERILSEEFQPIWLPKNDKYRTSRLISDEYKSIAVSYKTNDKEFIVEGITGFMNFFLKPSGKNNFEGCYPKQEEIVTDITKSLKNDEWKIHEEDVEEAKSRWIFITLKTGEMIIIQCTDWKKNIGTDAWTDDNLSISIYSEEFYKWGFPIY